MREMLLTPTQKIAPEFALSSISNLDADSGQRVQPILLGRPESASADRPFAAPLEPNWIQTPTFDILNTCRLGQDFRRETGAHFYAQAHISTQPAPSLKDAWLPLTHEDQIGCSCAQPPPRHRPEACLRQRRLSRLSLPRRLCSAGASQMILAEILSVLP